MKNLKMLPIKIWRKSIFIARNVIYSLHLKTITEKDYGNIIICGTARKGLKDVYEIYTCLNNNTQPEISRRILFFLLSKKYVLSAKDKTTGKIIGTSWYYRNKRDFTEKTIHAGFLGVLPEWRKEMVGIMLPVHSVDHFKNSNLRGISGRISLCNPSSLTTNMYVGFKPVEKYFCEDTNEERYYLICPLNDSFCWNFIQE